MARLSPVIIALLLLGAACGPTLRNSEDYTRKLVKEIRFTDQCKLQRYFDRQPPPLQQVSESGFGPEQGDEQIGKLTYQLKQGKQFKAFFKLLQRFYKRLPEQLDPAKPPRISVSYYRKGNSRHMPIGAQIVVEHDDDSETAMPYHPCVAAYFFGRDYYTMRKRLVAQGAL